MFGSMVLAEEFPLCDVGFATHRNFFPPLFVKALATQLMIKQIYYMVKRVCCKGHVK
jgi:hypothetical protein